jgi:hypothetical protein
MPDRKGARGPVFRLTAAHPETYLEWVAFVVATENAIRSRPGLRSKARARRLVFGDAAHTAHRVLLHPLTLQAEDANAAGETEFEPVIRASHSDLRTAVGYLERWGNWVVEEDVSTQTHVPLPSPFSAAITTHALKSIRVRIDAA